jgi:glycosyltransferase involved in cell wall biosynthesis
VARHLRSEADITYRWQRSEPPLVSIVCTTYNHARYVEQAIVGFLMQDTDFPFEVVIHDDVSTDHTRDIVSSYAARYPNLIRTVYQTENQYAQGKTSAVVAFGHCRGKYIAFCEGDDYWTDPQKLQLQCDLLESDPSCALVFHNCRLQYEARGDTRDEVACHLSKSHFTLEDVVLEDWFIPSQSMVFRRDALELPPWVHRVFGLDYAMHLLLARQGRIAYIDRLMGVYRINSASISGNRPPGFFQVKLIQTLSYFNFHTNFEHNTIIGRRLDRERELMYLAVLNGRPWYVRALSPDYLRFKLRNLLRRRRRRVPEPAALPAQDMPAA